MMKPLLVAAALALGACSHFGEREHARGPHPQDESDQFPIEPQTELERANARVARRQMEGLCGPTGAEQRGGRSGTSPGDYRCGRRASR
jgi:hypothetical protein